MAAHRTYVRAGLLSCALMAATLVACEPERMPSAPEAAQLHDVTVFGEAAPSAAAVAGAGGSDSYSGSTSGSGSTSDSYSGSGSTSGSGSGGCYASDSSGSPFCGPGIYILGPSALHLYNGDVRQLNAVFINPAGKQVAVEGGPWRSSNEAVATVDDRGVVVARGGGHAVISLRRGQWSDQITVGVLGGGASSSGGPIGGGTGSTSTSGD